MAKKQKKTLKYEEGDIMRVKETGALVRLTESEDADDPSIVDDEGYVYVEPVEEVAPWYHIDELERV